LQNLWLWPKKSQKTKKEANHKRAFGEAIEGSVEAYLKTQGLTPVTKNYFCKSGELDLVMLDKKTLVFIEVRYRKQSRYGSPLATITADKQRKLQLTAQHYLSTNYGSRPPNCRFDAVGVTHQNEQLTFQWVIGAF